MPRGVSRYDEARLQGRLWTPDALKPHGLFSWYDAADGRFLTIPSGATGISAWADRSGAGVDLSQGTSGNRPTFVQDDLLGRWVARFASASSQRVARTASSEVTVFNGEDVPYTKIALLRRGPAGVSVRVAGFGSTSTTSHSSLFIGSTNGLGLQRVGSGAALQPGSSNGELAADQWYIPSWVFKGTLLDTYSGGTQTLADGALNTNAPTFNSIQIGCALASGSYNTFFNGRIAELLIIKGALDQRARHLAEGYLAHKWGATSALAALHPYKNDPPLIGG